MCRRIDCLSTSGASERTHAMLSVAKTRLSNSGTRPRILCITKAIAASSAWVEVHCLGLRARGAASVVFTATSWGTQNCNFLARWRPFSSLRLDDMAQKKNADAIEWPSLVSADAGSGKAAPQRGNTWKDFLDVRYSRPFLSRTPGSLASRPVEELRPPGFHSGAGVRSRAPYHSSVSSEHTRAVGGLQGAAG
jgi:hypothetical protein